MSDVIVAHILTEAVDFLFDHGKQFLQDRQERRRILEQEVEQNKQQTFTTKDEVKQWPVKNLYAIDLPKEIQHIISMIKQYKSNERMLDKQASMYGSVIQSPIYIQTQLLSVDNEIKNWMQKLKNIIEQAYGHKIYFVGLE